MWKYRTTLIPLRTILIGIFKMSKLKFAFVAILVLFTTSVFAGGLLTYTNQSVNFLRNPGRDAVIDVDGVYSNPAGVVFMSDGLHLSFNIQSAYQQRRIVSAYDGLFQFNAKHPAKEADGYARRFKGKAAAPIMPSIQAAYNKGKLSYQFNFAVIGGGGKCEFEHGLGSFEGVVAAIPQQLIGAGLNNSLSAMGTQLTGGYDFDPYMRGSQIYYGFTLGTAYKLTKNFSVYGGLRLIYASSNYFGYVRDIALQVKSTQTGMNSLVNAPEFFNGLSAALNQKAGALEALGQTEMAQQVKQQAQTMSALGQQTTDIELNCDQTAWGLAPVLGVDWKLGKLNLAAKYEFKTRLRLKNKSANSESANGIAMLEQFRDGKKVPGDIPAMLTIGAQYTVIPSLRLSAGYHHFFDVDTKQYTKQMLGDTNEYLCGAEYDINKIVTVSAGYQKTAQDLKDDFQSDVSFNCPSYSFGFGVGVNVTEKVKINAAYFQTNYEHYTKERDMAQMHVIDKFHRTNRVFGVGVDLKL